MSAQANKKILLASARGEFVEVAQALARRGFEVHTCGDGSRALERALALVPDLLVVDVDIPVIEASRLAQILRANPRTDKLAFLFVGREGEEVEGFRRHRDHFLVRPFNHEQLLGVALGHLSRQERTEEVTRHGRQVEGNLEQVSLTDMLQIFGHNRKDGTLALERRGEKGDISLLEGTVVNARVGRVEGEKAFFRLLNWEQGRFFFSPGVPGGEVRITQPLDHLIMEGLRQSDELNAMAAVLPAADSLLFLKVPLDRLPRGLRPTTQEILVLLEYYQRVEDILDHCPRPDYDILQVIKVLIEKGLVEERREETAFVAEREPLLHSDDIILIKDRLGESDNLLEEATAKIILLAPAPEAIRRFGQTLQGIKEFEPEPQLISGAGVSGVCDLGLLRLGETFALRLLSLPASAEAAPLWAPFCRRLFGVLSLAGGDELAAAETFFGEKSGVPLVRVILGASGEGAFSLEKGNRELLRNLLAHLLAGFTQKGRS